MVGSVTWQAVQRMLLFLLYFRFAWFRQYQAYDDDDIRLYF